MTVAIFAGGLLVTFLVALWLTPCVRDLAYRKQWTDAPDNDRKIHTHETPRVGGLAIVSAFMAGTAYFALARTLTPGLSISPSGYILLGGLAIAAAGLYDDLRGMSVRNKFLVQVLVACFMIYGGYRIEVLNVPFAGEHIDLRWWISGPLTLVWIVGVINAVNLLDGMDGLAAGVTVIAFGSLTAAYASQGDLESLALVLTIVGALLGFLVYNFNPASIFMGDTGSMFIGFMLATYALRGTSHADPLLAFMIPVLALGLPVLDTGLAIVRRFIERRPLFHPDRDHIHHRVVRRLGLSHRNAVLLLYLASLLLGLAAFLVAISDHTRSAVILSVTGGVIYLSLRWLGYLRVRDSLRLIRERYGRARPVEPGLGALPVEAGSGNGKPAPGKMPTNAGDGGYLKEPVLEPNRAKR